MKSITRAALARIGHAVLAAALLIAPGLRSQTTVTDDHGNSPSTATLVTLPTTVNGALEKAGDYDYFKFTLAAPTVVTVTSGGTTDVVGGLLLGGSGTSATEIYSDNDGAGAPNFRLSQLLPAGTHYVYVRPLVYGTLGAYTVNFTGAAPAATQPDVSVTVDGTEVNGASLVDLGTAAVGSLITKDFVVSNVGDADLIVRTWRLASTMALPSGASFPFRIVSFSSGTIQPGRSSTVRVGFQSSVAGSFNGSVTLVTNDGDEIFYTIPIKGKADGALPSPEIVVRNGTADVANNGTIDFGSTMQNVRLTKDITIANTGAAELKITGYSITPVGNTTSTAFGFYNGTPPATVAAGAQATFKVSLFGLVTGSYAAKLTLYNSDADEATTVINLTGAITPDPVQGEIGVAVGGVNAPNNGTVAYGNNVTGVSLTKDFVISNTGTADLKITSWSLSMPSPQTVTAVTTTTTGSPIAMVTSASNLAVGMGIIGPFASGTSIIGISGTVVTFSSPATATLAGSTLTYLVAGPSASIQSFRIDSAVPTTIAAGTSATVKISYLPLNPGDNTATLTLYNNDFDENPYKLTLTGHADLNPNPADIAVSLGAADVPTNADVDFGSVPVSTIATKAFTLKNTGSSELRILGWGLTQVLPAPTSGTAAPIYFAGLPSSVIAAGQSATFTVAFKPTAAGAPYKSQITISSTDPDESSYKINILGTGAVYVSPTPEIDIAQNNAGIANNGSFSFGNVLTGGTVTKAFTIKNAGTATLNLTSFSILASSNSTTAPFRFEGALPSSTLAAGASASLNVSYAPTVVGDHTATLQVGNNDSDENPYRITLSGHADLNPLSPDIAVFLGTTELAQNAAIDFGTVARNTTNYKYVTVKNFGSATLTISSYGFSTVTPLPAPSPSAFTIGGVMSVAPGSSGTFTVTFRPAALGTTYTSALKINSNDPDESPYALTLTGASLPTDSEIGISIDGANLPSGGSLNFGGAVVIGTQVTKTITIANTGDAPLGFSGWSITPPAGTTFTSGPFPFIFSGALPTSIAPGATATVNFIYTPLAAGTHNLVATITNSDVDEGSYKINLTGAAVASTTPPEVAIAVNGTDLPSGGSISFGTVGVNSSVTRDLVISNSGTGDLRIGAYYTQNLTPAGSIAFTTIQAPPQLIPAGGSGVWKVSFRPTTVSAAYTGKLTLYSSDADENAFVINVSGSGDSTAPEIAISSSGANVPNNSVVALGTTLTSTVMSKSFTIANTGSAPLSLTSWSFISPSAGFGPGGNAFRLIGTLPTSLAVSTSATFTIEYSPLQAGDHTSILQVLNNDADESAFKINLTGHANQNPSAPDIAVFNGTVEVAQNGIIDFGAVPRNMNTSKMITIKNLGANTLNISSLGYTTVTPVPAPTTSAFNTGSFPATVAPGATTTLFLNFKPTALSTSYSSTLKINSNDPDEGSYTVTLTGSSLASDGEIAISLNGADVPNNSSLDFGSTVVGSQVTKMINIKNLGTVTLGLNTWLTGPAVSGTTVSGPLPFSYGAVYTTIAPGASVNVPLNFTPLSAGTHNYVYTISNTDSDEGTYKINVTGTATASLTPPDIAVSYGGLDVGSGGSVNFGSVAINTTVTREFLITNTGTDTLRIGAAQNLPVSPTNATAILISQSPSVTLAPGATTSWKFTFKPTAAGATYTSKLVIYNSDPDEGIFVINVTGSTAP